MINDEEIAEKVRRLRNYGSTVKYQHEQQTAYLREKLKVLDEPNARRREIAAIYSSLLSDCNCIFPLVPEHVEPDWHLYIIQSMQRDALKAHLDAQGISIVIHYPTPPHRQACYSNYSYEPLPVAEALADQVLSLPMFPSLKEKELEYVCNAVRNFAEDRCLS